MRYTEKLKLRLLDALDPVKREDLNANAKLIDDAWKKILTPETAKLFGKGPEATPNDIFAAIKKQAKIYQELARFTTPGAFTFTVPDSITHILAFIIGGGGSGAAKAGIYGSSNYSSCTGGGSGYLALLRKNVASGQVLRGVVGEGGVAVTARNNFTPSGNDGGTSSFDGIIAYGGKGGDFSGSASGFIWSTQGPGTPPYASNRRLTDGRSGGDTTFDLTFDQIFAYVALTSFFAPSLALSNFAAGGTAYGSSNDGYGQTMVKFQNGKTASAGIYRNNSFSSPVTAVKGTDIGCGGAGAIAAATDSIATSAAGMSGAVVVLGY